MNHSIRNLNIISKTNRPPRPSPQTVVSAGFTIVELLVVIVVIGILATMAIVSYNGIQQKVRDKTVLTDLHGLGFLESQYATVNGTSGKDWYSGNGVDTSLNFNPSFGNVIDVVTNASDYCIRGYNPGAATYNSLTTAATRESSPGACLVIVASAAASASSPTLGWQKISTSGYYTCAIASDNKVYCWGGGGGGALGNNNSVDSMLPVAVNTDGVLSGKTIKAVSAGGSACVIASDSQAYCWGSNQKGQLGNNSLTDSLVPVAVDTSGALSGKTIKAVSARGNDKCVIASDYQAYCWGENYSGSVGNGTITDPIAVPVAVDTSGVLSGKTIKSLAAGGSHACVIASDNKAYCWGRDIVNELGSAVRARSAVPVAVIASGVLNGKTMVAISASVNNTCALDSDGKAYCWGSGNYGALGNGTAPYMSDAPVAVDTSGVLNGKSLVSIDTNMLGTSCAIDSAGKAYCWGSNGYGALGNGLDSDSSVPVAVDTSGVLKGKVLLSISLSDSGACTVDNNGKAYCWGDNSFGQLGNNSTVGSRVPVASATAPTT